MLFTVTESEFSASGIVLNPRDWHNIALLKDNEGRYLFGGPQAFTSNIMWGLPVVPTKAQAAGTFTVGGFDMASQVWDRMDATVEVSREDRDNFVKNMLTILCEERGAGALSPDGNHQGQFLFWLMMEGGVTRPLTYGDRCSGCNFPQSV